MINLHPKLCRCYACQVTNLREALAASQERVKELEKDVAAMSAPCSECKCQMRVCMDCAQARIKALETELATSEAARAQAEKERDEAVARSARLAVQVINEKAAQAPLERERDEFKRMFSVAHMAALDRAKEAQSTEARALAAEAQVMVLREALEKITAFSLAPGARFNEVEKTFRSIASAALSSPAPSVVRLEEVQPLLEALEKVRPFLSYGVTFGDMNTAREIADAALSLWKQKQGGGQ